MTDRGTCWSITINNPDDSDFMVQLPAKWELMGQMEKGEQGTLHYQGMLTTPQICFSAVKRVFPKAHIELARNKKALSKYVSKEESRVQKMDNIVSNIPTLFDYQHTVAKQWDDNDFTTVCNELHDKPVDDCALEYVDRIVAEDIASGTLGIEYIAINPMWRSSWKKFWRSIIKRERLISDSQIYQDGIQETENSTQEENNETAQDGDAPAQSAEIVFNSSL